MIGVGITGTDGKPLPQYTKLSKSAYQPPQEVMELFSKCQTDYQLAWRLQHRPFDEFDGISLLDRARTDQQTFGAFVGAQYVAEHKRWRWRGRKNTARNKLIGILAHMVAGMLYPLVTAQNEDDEPDKMNARVMRIIVEEHLKKAGYELKFLYMVLSALVNPAVLVEVDYLVAYQRIKERLADGTYKITEAVDEFLTGLNLNIVPIDQLLLSDFYTNDIQKQPFIVRVNRISWDMARKIYAKRFYQDGKDLFDYVQAGKTRVFLAGQEHQTLFDIEWTEADRLSVQVITVAYRDEDLELEWVGGVGMFNYNDPYNSNPFKHRRLSLLNDEWKSIPIYQWAKSYYEPIDPAGRFAYGKSGAFKLYWDDATQNRFHQLFADATYLDTIKPLFISGVSKVDSVVIAPGATTGIPAGQNVTPWSMSPNIPAAMQVMQKQETDMGDSTQVTPLPDGQASPNIQATAVNAAQNEARMQLGVFGAMIADLVRQVGELTIDCVIQHTTTGEIDATVPEALKIRYKNILAKTKDKGRDVTNKIVFKSDMIGKKMTQDQQNEYEWKLWDKKGGDDQEVYHVNPYKFARMSYSMFVDPDEIVNHAMGNDRQEKILKYQMLTQQFVYPFTDQKEVANDVIEEFSDGDPDRLKAKQQANGVHDMMSAVMGGQPGQGGGQGGQMAPLAKPGVGVGAPQALAGMTH